MSLVPREKLHKKKVIFNTFLSKSLRRNYKEIKKRGKYIIIIVIFLLFNCVFYFGKIVIVSLKFFPH